MEGMKLMKAIIGDYRIVTSGYDLVLTSKDYTIKKDKNDNVKVDSKGEPLKDHKVYGYFTSLESLLSALPKQVILDNDDLNVIVDKLNEIRNSINYIKDTLNNVTEE